MKARLMGGKKGGKDFRSLFRPCRGSGDEPKNLAASLALLGIEQFFPSVIPSETVGNGEGQGGSIEGGLRGGQRSLTRSRRLG